MVKLNWTKEEKEEAIERMRANLPPDMLKYNNFVCFKLKADPASHSGWGKIPINPNTDENARSNDSTTWGSFDEAASAWIKSSTLHGIGFMFGNSPFFGVDIDDVGDKLDSRDFDGADMVQALHTYTEYSPSETGLHCICMGELPPEGRKNKTTKMEMYSDGRFFTMTGNVYAYPRTISDCTESIKPYHAKYIKPPSKPKKPTNTHRPAAVGTLAEDEIIRKASNAANGSTFKALYFDGDTSAYGGDDSAADMALCNLLAFWTGKNAGTMDTLFRKSALYRPKWDEKRGTETYGEITINEAINFCDRCYEGGSAPKYIISSPTIDSAPPADQSENAADNIYNWTDEQWITFTEKCYGTIHPEHGSCVEFFKRYYLAHMSNGLLTDDEKLPEYIQPCYKKIHDVYCLTGFVLNFRLLAESLRKDHHITNIATIANTTGAMYVYDPRGKYDKVSTEEERGIIHERLEMFDRKGGLGWNTKTIKDVSFLLHSPHETKLLDDFNADEDIINFQNGLYNIKTGKLLPHTHTVLSTVQLPLDYDPKAADRPTPAFDSMLDHLSGGRDDVKQLILQFSAAIISNIDIGKLKTFLMIYGARDSGKSQLFYLLSQLLGKNNFCVTSMTLLAENRFEPYNLYGMRLAGRPELEIGEVVKHHSKIKELTGGDPTRAEIKNGGTFTFRFKGGLLFTSNERPQLENADEAFYTRLRLIYVEQSLQHKDPQFMEKLWNERQAIAMKLLPLIPEIKERGTIIDPVSSIALKKEYRAENDPVIDFFVNHCEMSDKRDDTTLFSRVYSLYKNWAGKCNYDIVSAKKFSNTLDSYIKREGLTRGKFDRYGKPLGATVQGAGRKTFCTFEVIPGDWTFSVFSIQNGDENPKK